MKTNTMRALYYKIYDEQLFEYKPEIYNSREEAIEAFGEELREELLSRSETESAYKMNEEVPYEELFEIYEYNVIALFEHELIEEALSVALNGFAPEIIIDIIENNEGGWTNGAEYLNQADLNMVKIALSHMCANCKSYVQYPYEESNASFCNKECHDEWYEKEI